MRLNKENKAADALLEAETAHKRTAERTASEIRQSNSELIERGNLKRQFSVMHRQERSRFSFHSRVRQGRKGRQSTSL